MLNLIFQIIGLKLYDRSLSSLAIISLLLPYTEVAGTGNLIQICRVFQQDSLTKHNNRKSRGKQLAPVTQVKKQHMLDATQTPNNRRSMKNKSDLTFVELFTMY